MVTGKTCTMYCVEREILDEQRLEELSRRLDSSQTHTLFSHRLKNSLRCSIPKLKRTVVGFLPVLYWLPHYSVWDYGMPDLISGISVGIMHLPQGMAYALLASLPPVFGLYSSFYPALVYFFFGSSRHISIGTFTILSIMVGSVTERLAPDENFLIVNKTSGIEEVDITARDLYRVQVAAATTVLGGSIQVILGLMQFGFVGTYLSEPLVRAYTSAAAAHAVLAQLKTIFGVSPARFSGPLSMVYTLVDVCGLLPNTHLPTLVVSVLSIVILITAKELNNRCRKKLQVPIPVELIIVVGTLISFYAHLNETYEISVVGKIPSGIQPPTMPNASIFPEVVVDAFALAIVGYAISVSLGKTFALKHGYKIDSSQELVALGLSNAVGGFFQCYSVCASMSRSLIQETTGGRTQMAGIASSVIVLVTMMKLGSLFQELPKVVWLVTWVSTLLLNLDMGLAASISFAMLTVIFRTQSPRYSVLGHLPGTELYLDLESHREVREVPGITIFRSSATIYFANAELYLEALKEKSGLDITKMITYKRRQEAKQRKRDRRAARRAKRQAKRQVNMLFSIKKTNGNIILKDAHKSLHRSIHFLCVHVCRNKLSEQPLSDLEGVDLERISLGSLGKWTWDIHSIILDLSTANFIDTVALKTLRNIFHDFGEIDVDIYIAGCQAPVVEQLEQGGFFSDITKERLFTTVHDAVLYCINLRGDGTLVHPDLSCHI
uniref:STAS domain-containing protein n=1 Tax=Electrophorus electricus TaxID=8005 RepID=A0A4W4F497_ELEEL